MARYKFYDYKEKDGTPVVVCVSSYAGRPVKGRAKCSPHDTFDAGKGRQLAQARCDLLIAQKRQKRATMKMREAYHKAWEAQMFLEDMNEYNCDAAVALKQARENLDTLMTEL